MNAYANRNKLAVVLLALLTVFSAGAVLASDASDADNAYLNSISASDFYENKNGTLTIPIQLDGDRTIHVVIKENGNTVVDKTFTDVPASTTSVSVSFSLSAGTHILNDICVTIGGVDFHGNYTLEVKKDIWSSVGTYIALVIVAIVIIAIVVIYMRARPNNKPTTTFTQLEEEKKAAAAAPEKEKAAPKTEKIKYTSSRRK